MSADGAPSTGTDARAFFDEHGWLVVRGAVPAARAAELAALLDTVIPPASYVAWGPRIVEIPGIGHAAPALGEQVRDPVLAAIAGEVLGASRVQLLQDTALIKAAATDAQLAWHQDASYMGYLDRLSVVTVRLALTPCTEDNGCMRVIDGSHRWGLQGDDLAFRQTSVTDTLDALPAELRERARGAERALVLEPGDVSVHGCLTFHGSGANRSDAARKTLAVRMLDGACRLVPERLPEHLRAIFTTDDDGHLTGPMFPLLWERR